MYVMVVSFSVIEIKDVKNVLCTATVNCSAVVHVWTNLIPSPPAIRKVPMLTWFYYPPIALSIYNI